MNVAHTLIPLRYGNTNTYYLGGLLIDTELPGTLSAFYKELKRHGLSLGDIRYVLATHYHPDHMGLIGELMEAGVRLLLVDKQKDFVHFADSLFAREKHSPFRPIREEEATVIGLRESRAFLASLGIDGELVPTESHSPDGIALLTDGGVAVVGDLEPYAYLAGYDGNALLEKDWARLLRRRPLNVYYGHANSTKIE